MVFDRRRVLVREISANRSAKRDSQPSGLLKATKKSYSICSILLITCLWFLGYYIFGKGDFCKAVSALTLLSLFPLNSLRYCLCLVSIILTLFTPSHLLKPRHYIWRRGW